MVRLLLHAPLRIHEAAKTGQGTPMTEIESTGTVYQVGDRVRIISGPRAGLSGDVAVVVPSRHVDCYLYCVDGSYYFSDELVDA